MLKKKVNGTWSGLENVKEKTNGTWSDCTSVKKKNNGSWSKVWSSSTFYLRDKNFVEPSGYSYAIEEMHWLYVLFKTVSTRMDGTVFQMGAKGSILNTSTKFGIACGNKFVEPKSDSFYLHIDQEIVESNKATVEAISLAPTISEYYDWNIIRRYAFTSSRQIKSIRIPGDYSKDIYLYFYISSDEWTEDSSTTPSATARIYGMWTDTQRYDLYDPYSYS